MEDLTQIPGASTLTALLRSTVGIDLGYAVMIRVSRHRYTGNWEWEPCEPHVELLAFCSDTFAWGSADAEEITDETLPVFLDSLADVLGLPEVPPYPHHAAADLYAARVRGIRPQGAVYHRRYAGQDALHALFDKAGPPREAGPGNPQER